jgi:hypothetical protein
VPNGRELGRHRLGTGSALAREIEAEAATYPRSPFSPVNCQSHKVNWSAENWLGNPSWRWKGGSTSTKAIRPCGSRFDQVMKELGLPPPRSSPAPAGVEPASGDRSSSKTISI